MVEIQTVAVIGAGITGRGIAQVAALGGYRTILEDILPASLRRAESEMRGNLEKSVAEGEISRHAADAAMARVEYASSVDQAAREADLVIESVPEEWESKVEIFTLLDKVCRPHTILASNTHSFSVTEIASVTYRAPMILGVRFINPVPTMRELEVVRARETDAQTLAAFSEVVRRMGKQVVVITETPDGLAAKEH